MYIQIMKIFILLLCFLPAVSFGQKIKTDPTNPDGLREKNFDLSFSKIAPREIKLPFSSIEIIDNRFDTSKLGFVPEFQFIADKKRVGRKITFDQGVAKAMENYYNQFYEHAFEKNDIKLLIVLRKFWLSGIDDKKNKVMDISKNPKSRSFLYCKWEYYLNKGNKYMPIQRIDTVINGVLFNSEKNEMDNYKTENEILKLILNGLIEVYDFKNAVDKIDKIKVKTFEQLKLYNASLYDIPVLKDSVFKKGVFRNFIEFKNNSPSIINFKEKKIRVSSNNYKHYIEDDKGNRIINYWGYFTGDELRIGKYENDKLHRKNNTFEFFLKHLYQTQYFNISGSSSSSEREVWIPYQIDMETGEIY